MLRSLFGWLLFAFTGCYCDLVFVGFGHTTILFDFMGVCLHFCFVLFGLCVCWCVYGVWFTRCLCFGGLVLIVDCMFGFMFWDIIRLSCMIAY